MSEKNKWAKVLSELERTLPTLEKEADIKIGLERFMGVDENYCDQFHPHLYLGMWKLALRIGKLKLAKIYALKSLKYLIDYKRIPQLNLLIHALDEAGILKDDLKIYIKKRDVLIGKKAAKQEDYKNELELMFSHPEYWKSNSEFINAFLLLEREWSVDHWKFCYECILTNHLEKELFIFLTEKAGELGKEKAQQQFIEFLQKKKIKFKKVDHLEKRATMDNYKEKLIVDYDLIAMELLSGAVDPTYEEQKRVMNSLKFISKEEMLTKGWDMAVAFELLGMEHVVICLCEQLSKISKDIKALIGIYYLWAQSLFNLENHFKVIALVDEVMDTQPLYGDERLAFLYLKAESYLKLNKIKMAKDLYQEIKKESPHYRMVRERLRSIETNK